MIYRAEQRQNFFYILIQLDDFPAVKNLLREQLSHQVLNESRQTQDAPARFAAPIHHNQIYPYENLVPTHIPAPKQSYGHRCTVVGGWEYPDRERNENGEFVPVGQPFTVRAQAVVPIVFPGILLFANKLARKNSANAVNYAALSVDIHTYKEIPLGREGIGWKKDRFW